MADYNTYQMMEGLATRTKEKFNNIDNSNTEFSNVKSLGALSDGTNSDTAFSSDAKGYIVNDGIYSLSKNKLINVLQKPIIGNGSVKYVDYYDTWTGNAGLMTGEIPIAKLDDQIYLSMTLPSDETITTSRGSRLNGYIGYYPDSTYHSVNSMGAIYTYASSIDTETITLCIGKLRTMGFSEKSGNWVTITESAKPKWWAISNLNWDGWLDGSGVTVTEYEDYVKYVIPSSLMLQGIFHFDTAESNEFDYSDIKYLMSYVEAWADTEDAFLLAGGADLRDNSSNILQGIYTRFVKLSKNRRYCIGHTLPTNLYDMYVPDWKNTFSKLSANVYEKTSYKEVVLFPPNKANSEGGDDIWFLKVPLSNVTSFREAEIKIDIIHPKASKAHALYKADLFENNGSFSDINGGYSSVFQIYKVESVDGSLTGKIKAITDTDGNIVFYVCGLSSGDRVIITIRNINDLNPYRLPCEYNKELLTYGIVSNPQVSDYPSLTDISATSAYWES